MWITTYIEIYGTLCSTRCKKVYTVNYMLYFMLRTFSAFNSFNFRFIYFSINFFYAKYNFVFSELLNIYKIKKKKNYFFVFNLCATLYRTVLYLVYTVLSALVSLFVTTAADSVVFLLEIIKL